MQEFQEADRAGGALSFLQFLPSSTAISSLSRRNVLPTELSDRACTDTTRRTGACSAAFRAIGSVAVLAAIATIAVLLVSWFELPLFTLQGLRNLAFHLLHDDGSVGLATAALFVLVASPWIV